MAENEDTIAFPTCTFLESVDQAQYNPIPSQNFNLFVTEIRVFEKTSVFWLTKIVLSLKDSELFRLGLSTDTPWVNLFKSN